MVIGTARQILFSKLLLLYYIIYFLPLVFLVSGLLHLLTKIIIINIIHIFGFFFWNFLSGYL